MTESAVDPLRYRPLPLTLTVEELAIVLCTTAKTVGTSHRVWSRSYYFPTPIPGMRDLRWSGPQVERWLAGEPDIGALQGKVSPLNCDPSDPVLERYGAKEAA